MKDLTGQRFGRLTVIQSTPKRKGKRIVWACRCDCGELVFADGRALRDGYAKSCGCLKTEEMEQKRKAYIEKLSGKRFGKLTLVRPTEEQDGSNIVWECLCDCGNTTVARMDTLRRGTKKSCGCLRKEQSMQKAAELEKQR